MDCLTRCLAPFTECWTDRAVVNYKTQQEIGLIRGPSCYHFRQGVALGVGPSYGEEKDAYFQDGHRIAEACIMEETWDEGTIGDRVDIVEDCCCMPCCCIIDITKDVVACAVDSCVALYFSMLVCMTPFKRHTAALYCGSACGDCLDIPLTIVYSCLRTPHLGARFCCFDTLAGGKQKCVPFPIVDDRVFYRSDWKRVIAEGKTYSEEARQNYNRKKVRDAEG